MANEISPGGSKQALISIFGPPEVVATGAELGQLHEQIIYIDRSAQRKTIIAAVDGTVTAAVTYFGAEAR